MPLQLTRRSFHRLAASGAALAGSHALWPLARADEPADVPWVSDDPHLSGNFLPVQREVDARDLRVVSGRIPADLRGVLQHDRFALANGPTPTFKRMTIDPARRSFEVASFSNEVTEFPRFNHLREALPTRFVYMPTLTSSLKEVNPPSAVFNTVLKVDTETGRYTRHDLGNQIVGEAAFVPRPGGRAEDDDYLAAFTYDPVRQGSNLVLLNARRIEEPPVAVIEMPQRVPQGLHGNWIART